MTKTTMTAAFAAIMAASMPMAFAQTSPTTPSPSTSPSGSASTSTSNGASTSTKSGASDHSSVSANHVLPGQIRVTQMDGATVYDPQNQSIGDIKDMILDKEGKVAAVVLNVGATLGMGGRYVAVPMNDLKIKFDENNRPKFSIDRTQEQLKTAQAFDLSEKTATSGTSTPPARTSSPATSPATNPNR